MKRQPAQHAIRYLSKLKMVLCTLSISSITLFGVVGCSMCCGPYDYDYPTFGGKHERTDRAYGRLGSIFSDPQASYYNEDTDSSMYLLPESNSSFGSGSKIRSDDQYENGQQLDGIKESVPFELPKPDEVDDEPTANRFWKNRPLRR